MSEYGLDNVVEMVQWKEQHEQTPRLLASEETTKPAEIKDFTGSTELLKTQALETVATTLPEVIEAAIRAVERDGDELDRIRNDRIFNTVRYSAWLQGQDSSTPYTAYEEDLFKGAQARHKNILTTVKTVAEEGSKLLSRIQKLVLTPTTNKATQAELARAIPLLTTMVNTMPAHGLTEAYTEWLTNNKNALEMAYSVENKAVPQATAHS